jgi:START domain
MASFVPAPLPADAGLRAGVEAQLLTLEKLSGPEESISQYWKANGTTNGVHCFVPTDSFPAARGDGIIPFPIAALMPLLVDVTLKGQTDSQFEKGHVVQRIDDHTSISYMKFRGMGFVSGRDFCNLTHWRLEEDGRVLIVAAAHEHRDCPEVKGAVRGQLEIGGWLLKPLEGGNSCSATYLMRSDFKGSIPGWVTRQVASQQATIVATLRDLLIKRYKNAEGFLESVRRMAPSERPPYMVLAPDGRSVAIRNLNPAAAGAKSVVAASQAVSTPGPRESGLSAVATSPAPSTPLPPPRAIDTVAASEPRQASSINKAPSSAPPNKESTAPVSTGVPAPPPVADLEPEAPPAPPGAPSSFRLFPEPGPEDDSSSRFAPDPFVPTASLGGSASGNLAFRTELPPAPADPAEEGYQAWRVADSASRYALSLLSDPVLASTSPAGSSCLLVDRSNPNAQIRLHSEDHVPASPLTLLHLLTASSPSFFSQLVAPLKAQASLSHALGLATGSVADSALNTICPSSWAPQYQANQTATFEGGLSYRLLQHYRVIGLPPSTASFSPASSGQHAGKQHGVLVVRASLVADGQGHSLSPPLWLEALLITPTTSNSGSGGGQISGGLNVGNYEEDNVNHDSLPTAADAASCSRVHHLFCVFGGDAIASPAAKGQSKQRRVDLSLEAALRAHGEKVAPLLLQRLSEGLRSCGLEQGGQLWRQAKRDEAAAALLKTHSPRGGAVTGHRKQQSPIIKGVPLLRAVQGFLSPFGLAELPSSTHRSTFGQSAHFEAVASSASLRDPPPSIVSPATAASVSIAAAALSWVLASRQGSISLWSLDFLLSLPKGVLASLMIGSALLVGLIFLLASHRRSNSGPSLRTVKSSGPHASALVAEAPGGTASLRLDLAPLLSLWFRLSDAAAAFLPVGLPSLVGKAACLALQAASKDGTDDKHNTTAARPLSAIVIAPPGVSSGDSERRVLLSLDGLSEQSLSEAAFFGALTAATLTSSSDMLKRRAEADVVVVLHQGVGGGRSHDDQIRGKEVTIHVDISAVLRAVESLDARLSSPSASSPTLLRSARQAAALLGNPSIDMKVSFSQQQGGKASSVADHRRFCTSFLEHIRVLLSSSSALLSSAPVSREE